MYEELPDEEKADGFRPTAVPASRITNGNGNGHPPACEECGQVLTAAQSTYSLRRHGQELCPEHQKTVTS
jgi:hypothetical protein